MPIIALLQADIIGVSANLMSSLYFSSLNPRNHHQTPKVKAVLIRNSVKMDLCNVDKGPRFFC